MNISAMMKRIGGVALALTVLIGIGAESAQAQWPDRDYRNDRYGDRYGYDNRVRWEKERTREYAYMLGYHNAYSEAKDVVGRGYRGSYRDMAGYRNDSNGWLEWMGDNRTYREYYRKGYEAGFKDVQAGRQRRYERRDIERVLGDSMKNVYGRDDYYDDDYYDRGNWGRNDRGRNDGRGGYGRYDRNDIYRIAQQNGYREGFDQGQEDRSRRRSTSYERNSEYRDAMRGYRSEYGDRSAYQQGFRDGYRRGYEDAFRNRGNDRGRFPWPF